VLQDGIKNYEELQEKRNSDSSIKIRRILRFTCRGVYHPGKPEEPRILREFYVWKTQGILMEIYNFLGKRSKIYDLDLSTDGKSTASARRRSWVPFPLLTGFFQCVNILYFKKNHLWSTYNLKDACVGWWCD